jgi:ornithine cyclodeaminase
MIPWYSEDDVRAHLTPERAFAAVREAFVASWRGEGRNFPVVREAIGVDGRVFGVKSGAAPGLLGLKAGGYWPGNESRGLGNHQSTILLFDEATGRPAALVSANLLTALRTAAASAVSIATLARADARTLGVVGAGRQAAFQVRAALATRPFERVLVWNRTAAHAEALVEALRNLPAAIVSAPLERTVSEADAVVTVLSANAPVVQAKWVRPGTHVAAMGTDTRGKQEIEPRLLAEADLFTDEVAQSVSIGEAQHAVAQGLVAPESIVPLGAVLDGALAGRRSETAITLYDGTGVALQDLVAARAVFGVAAAPLAAGAAAQ